VNAAQPAGRWRKSSRSGSSGDNCVEVARLPGAIGVRDSKNPDGPGLAISAESFAHLVRTVKAAPSTIN
jgi:hypothetical protein